MCIRDSASHLRLPALAAWSNSHGPSRKSTACSRAPASGPAWSPAAVSYTHLTLPTICSV
eukprot:4602635-Alexandrium_andersonii.AAC.1